MNKTNNKEQRVKSKEAVFLLLSIILILISGCQDFFNSGNQGLDTQPETRTIF